MSGYPGAPPSGYGAPQGYPGAPPSSGYPGAPPQGGGYPGAGGYGGAPPQQHGGYGGGQPGGGYPGGGYGQPGVDPQVAQWFNAVDTDRYTNYYFFLCHIKINTVNYSYVPIDLKYCKDALLVVEKC